MRWLEVRRHSFTKMGGARGRGSHLSQAGVSLARSVGEELGAFHRVVVSEVPRALETAIAMGYAVDEVIAIPSAYVPGEVDHHDQWRWPQPYARYAELLRQQGRLARVACAQLELWRRVLSAIPDEASALIVGHGGTIEPALVAALPLADHESWGPPFRHCDGARLTYDGDFVDIEFRRVPEPETSNPWAATTGAAASLGQDAAVREEAPASSPPAQVGDSGGRGARSTPEAAG